MIFKCIANLNILFYIFLLVSKTSFGQECSSDGINCISCTEYQNCNGEVPEGRVISCKTGDNCTEDRLKQCQMKLNCYALNECTEPGIFPDVMVDSNYYVCLNDGSSGFFKYEFICPEGNFFDKASLTCVPRDVTLAATEVPSSSSVSVDPTSSPTTIDPTSTVSTSSISPSTSTDPTSSTSPSTSTDPTSSTSPSTSSDPTSSTSPSTSTDPTSSTSPSTSTDPTSSTSPSTSTDPTSSTSPSTSSDPTSSTSPSTSTDPTSSTFPSTSSDPTPSTSTGSTSPSTSTDPTSTPTSSTFPSTPSTPTPTTMPFLCLASGIFPNPDNCKMYYRCSTSLKAFFYICPGNSYFNEIILKCSMIITPSCQEQILKNSTSTVPPITPTVTTTTTVTAPMTTTTTTPKPTTSISTTTTTTTTSAPTPTTTTTTLAPTPTTTTTTLAPTTTTTTPATTTTTTTTPSSSTPFSCPMTGIYANPSDCKIYYRCALSGQIFQYVCPGNTYFNEYTKRCSLVVTPRCKNLIQG